MKKSTQFFLAVATMTFFGACTKENNEEVRGCDPAESNAALQFADKSTGKDLFFGENPKYKLEDLKIYRIKDTTFQNPLKLHVIGVNPGLFLMSIKSNQLKDTMVVKIADTPADQLIYTIKKLNDPCQSDQMEQVTFNNTAVLPIEGIFVFKK